MKMLWCWRCKMEVPMLDIEEFAIARELYSQAFKHGQGSMEQRFKPLLDYYNDITHWNETVPNAIMHHCIDDYGPPCETCGKPYRTALAKLCAACGHKRPGYN